MFSLTTHATHFNGYMTSNIIMVKDHIDNDKGNLLPPLHGYSFSISSSDLCYSSCGALAGNNNNRIVVVVILLLLLVVVVVVVVIVVKVVVTAAAVVVVVIVVVAAAVLVVVIAIVTLYV